MTFDTQLPDENVVSHLGSAGQRWLLAHGPYSGAQAELTIYSAKGGLFDMADPKPEVNPIGSMIVQFENCSNGSITYDLPTINRTGAIHIQRVALDNVAACEGAH